MREEYPAFSFTSSAGDPGDDPRVRVDVQPQLTGRNRVTVFFRFLLAIPHFLVLGLLAIGAYIAGIVAFFTVLFTGRWPEGMMKFVLGVARWGVRAQAYYLMLTDEYPPFSLD